MPIAHSLCGCALGRQSSPACCISCSAGTVAPLAQLPDPLGVCPGSGVSTSNLIPIPQHNLGMGMRSCRSPELWPYTTCPLSCLGTPPPPPSVGRPHGGPPNGSLGSWHSFLPGIACTRPSLRPTVPLYESHSRVCGSTRSRSELGGDLAGSTYHSLCFLNTGF